MASRKQQDKPVRRHSRKLAVATVLAAALVLVWQLVHGSSPVSAMDGRVPDSRPATREGEVSALYWHGLNRDPDPQGMQNYMSFVNNNCRWGLLDASFKILGSGEAQAKWKGNPQTLAGMLYASLLNRPPDPGGLRTYTNAIRSRGLNWAIASMLASPEYNARLDRLCAPYPKAKESVRMYTPAEAEAFVKDTLFPRAENLAKSCAMTFAFTQSVTQLKRIPLPATQFVGRASQLATATITVTRTNGTCGAVAKYVWAGVKIAEQVNAGSGNNPVLIQFTVDPPWVWNIFDQTEVVFRIGPDPAHWTAVNAKVRTFER